MIVGLGLDGVGLLSVPCSALSEGVSPQQCVPRDPCPCRRKGAPAAAESQRFPGDLGSKRDWNGSVHRASPRLLLGPPGSWLMRGRAGSSCLPGLRERGLWLRNRGFAVKPPRPHRRLPGRAGELRAAAKDFVSAEVTSWG